MGARGYFGGLSYSAYQPYNWYWQPELMYFGGEEMENEIVTGSFADGQFTIDTLITTLSSCNRIDVVPLQIRKNVNSFLGIGLGAQFSLERCQLDETAGRIRFTPPGGEMPFFQALEPFTPQNRIETTIRPAVFLDLNLGLARIGPSLGARYLYDFKGYDCAEEGVATFKKHGRIQLYAIWRI